MLQYNPSISGSLNITGSLIISNGMIGTVNGVDVQIFSSSINQVITGIQAATGSQEGRLGSIESFTSSTSARLNSIETISASNIARISSLETTSASVDTLNNTQNSRLNALETTSASVDTLNTTQNSRLSALETTSASVDTLNTTQNIRLTNLEIKTGSLATTGSNTFIGTQTITGSLFVSANLIVQGTSSLQNITASAVSIGTNIVNLNTANPAIRYAGLVIGDSGSIGSSGSFFYDSVQDEMIFIHRGANTTVTSSVTLMGPQTFDNIGNETYPTNNRIQKGTGNEHLVDSCIIDDGTTVCVNTTLKASGQVCGIMSTFSCAGIATTSLSSTYGTLTIAGTGVSIADDGNAKLQIGRYSSTACNAYIKMGTNACSLRFTNNTDLADLLVIEKGGNVGIGTNSPQKLLELRTGGTSTTPSQIFAGGISQAIVGGEAQIALSSNISPTAGTPTNMELARGGIGFQYLSAAQPSEFSIGIQCTNVCNSNVKIWNNAERLTISSTGIATFACRVFSSGLTTNGNLNWNTGDGTDWYIRGQANGPAIRMKYHGGSTNRSAGLGWVDNNSNYYETLCWQDTSMFAYGILCSNNAICAASLFTNAGGLTENFTGTGGGHINRYFAAKYMPENQTTAFFKITTSGASATYINLVGTNAGVGWYSSQVYHAANSAYWGGWIGSGAQISLIGASAGYITGTHSDGAGGQTFCVLVANNGTGTSSLIFAYITTVTYGGYSTTFTQL
jgi:hypothetical protein